MWLTRPQTLHWLTPVERTEYDLATVGEQDFWSWRVWSRARAAVQIVTGRPWDPERLDVAWPPRTHDPSVSPPPRDLVDAARAECDPRTYLNTLGPRYRPRAEPT